MFGIDLLGFARDLYETFMNMLVNFISVSVDFSGVKFVQDMIGNAEGVGLYIAGYVAILMVLGAMVAKRYRYNALVSTVIAFMAPVLFTIWLAILDGLRSIGTGLTSLFVGIDPLQIKSNLVLPFPAVDIAAAMWNVPIFTLSGATGFWFLIMFAMMFLVNILLAVVGVWAIAFYGFGPRSRRNFSILVSIVLVTFCLGQATVVAIIKLSNVVGAAMPVSPGSVGLAGLFGLGGLWLAALVFLGLPLLMYFPVHAVAGKVSAAVSNRVNSQVNNKPKVDANVKGQVTTQNNRLESAQKPSYQRAMGTEIRKAAAITGSAALLAMLKKSATAAAAAGSKVHPATAVAFTGGSLMLKAAGNAPAKPKKEKDFLVYR